MRILILAPHPDDVELAMGGTLYKLSQDKKNLIRYICFTHCGGAVNELPVNDSIEYQIFDCDNKHLYQHRQDILDILDEEREGFRPELVFCPSSFDTHQDHRVVNKEATRCYKSFCSILGYEQPWNNLDSNYRLFYRLNSQDMGNKWEYLKYYQSQKKKPYFKEAFIYGQAQYRGIQCDSEYAESFEVIKWIM